MDDVLLVCKIVLAVVYVTAMDSRLQIWMTLVGQCALWSDVDFNITRIIIINIKKIN